MEFSGEEKKLQALFSELKTADEETAPRFARVWNRAQPGARRVRAFNPAFVAATALLVCAVVSLLVWSRYSQPTERPSVAKVETTVSKPANVNSVSTATIVSEPGVTIAGPVKEKRPSTPKASRRNSTQLAANRKLTRDAKAITDWESPTSALLSSSSDALFSSLPQFNQSTSDLKSFLPSRSN